MIAPSAYVAPSAVLCGAVTLGERTRVLHGAVLTAEDGEIWIGDDVVIMETLWCVAVRSIRSRSEARCSSVHTSTGTRMRTIMARQSDFYGAHRDDQIIDG